MSIIYFRLVSHVAFTVSHENKRSGFRRFHLISFLYILEKVCANNGIDFVVLVQALTVTGLVCISIPDMMVCTMVPKE